MAKARAIIKRRKAVQNIHKITRTMQLIATARFQAAFNRAVASRPYAERIMEMAGRLALGRAVEHPLLTVNTKTKRTVLIALTSNRGMCGGYNSMVLDKAIEHIEEQENAGQFVDLHAVGKKGIAYFKFLGRPMSSELTVFEDKPQFAEVEPIASVMMDAYERQQIDSVYVTYTRFISTAHQRVETICLLPVSPPKEERLRSKDGRPEEIVYEFLPHEGELLAELLPQTVKVRLFQCFIDAAVSEQVARMVAMKSATDSAVEMIRSLTQHYNRARQSQITLDLLDIVGGAEALQ